MRLRIEIGSFVFDTVLGRPRAHKSIEASLKEIRARPRVLGVGVMDERREWEIEQQEIAARKGKSGGFGSPGS